MRKKRTKKEQIPIASVIRSLFIFAFASIIAFLMVTLINISGIRFHSPIIYFIYPLVLILAFYLYHKTRIKRIKRERIEIRDRIKSELSILPKVYDFYCPRCLYQTNDKVEVCPNCGMGKLSPTSGSL